MASMLYSLIRVVLDAIATSHHNEAKLRAEVLALRQQVQDGRTRSARVAAAARNFRLPNRAQRPWRAGPAPFGWPNLPATA